jgi:hypothetical protein
MRHFAPTAVLFASLTLLACSQPPEKERGQAEGAIAAARAASADVYAADELLAAEQALEQYDAAVTTGDYRQALNAALEARDRAYAAVTRASTARAEARGRADSLVTTIESLSAMIELRLSGAASPRLAGLSAQRLRDEVTRTSTILQEARTTIGAGHYLVAIPQLEAALAALQKEFDGATGRIQP